MAENTDEKKSTTNGRASRKGLVQRIRQFANRDIWDFGLDGEPSLSGQGIALLRVLLISWQGLFENKLFSRAAALSYSSLIALGPLVAIVVFFSSSFVNMDAETQIKRTLLFIAPSVQEMVTIEGESAQASGSEMSSAIDELIAQIVDGAENIVSGINTSGSTTFGLVGSLILIWVVIQLLTSVETTLNEIWGVHQGRPWSQRIVFYWTFISLGAILGLGSTALFSASNVARMTNSVPFGGDVSGLVLALTPLISFAMLVLLLVLFYRFFPNTSVKLKAAFVGSILTACLLTLNNYLSILYVQRVLSFQSFYGSLGIIPVLMIGLYFFWVLVLLGGQMTYSVQNVSFLTNQAAWKRTSPIGREIVTLGAFLFIARKFSRCEAAPSLNDISKRLQIPVNILNESLEMLENLEWITRISRDEPDAEEEGTGFRPTKPLKTYNLSKFRSSVEGVGKSALLPRLIESDPLLKQYREALKWHEKEAFFQTNLQDLLEGPTTGSS